MTDLTIAFVVKLINETVAPMKALMDDITKVGQVSSSTAVPVTDLGTAVQNSVAPAAAATQSATDLARSLATVAPAADAASAAVADSGEATTAASGKWTEFAKNIGGRLAGDALIGIGALVAVKTAIVGAVAAAVSFVRGQAQVAEATLNAASAAGVNAQAYQRLQYAFKQSGLDAGVLDKSVGALNKNLVAAQAGSKQQAATFHALGIKVKDTTGRYKAADVVMGEVADKFAAMKDGARKATLAANLFGDAGAALIPMLNGGSKGLKAMGDQADKLGLILSNDTLTASQKLNAIWDVTASKIDGLKLKLFAGLLPQVTKLVQVISDIIEQNREDILKGLETGLDWISENMPAIIKGTKDFFGALRDIALVSASVISAVGGINGVLDIFAVTMIGKVAWSLAAATIEVWGFDAALWGCPIVWIIAGIAALAAGAYLLIRHWGAVSKFFGNLWGWFKNAFLSLPVWAQVILNLPLTIVFHWKKVWGFFTGLWDWLKNAFLSLPGWAQAIINLPLAIVLHWKQVWGFFTGLWAWLKKSFLALPTWAQAFINLPLTIIVHWKEFVAALAGIWDGIKKGFKDGVDAVWNVLPDWFRQILKGVAFVIKIGADSVANAFKGDPKEAAMAKARSDYYADRLAHPDRAQRDDDALKKPGTKAYDDVVAKRKSLGMDPQGNVVETPAARSPAAPVKAPITPLKTPLAYNQPQTFNGNIGLTIKSAAPVQVDHMNSSDGLELWTDRGSMFG